MFPSRSTWCTKGVPRVVPHPVVSVCVRAVPSSRTTTVCVRAAPPSRSTMCVAWDTSLPIPYYYVLPVTPPPPSLPYYSVCGGLLPPPIPYYPVCDGCPPSHTTALCVMAAPHQRSTRPGSGHWSSTGTRKRTLSGILYVHPSIRNLSGSLYVHPSIRPLTGLEVCPSPGQRPVNAQDDTRSTSRQRAQNPATWPEMLRRLSRNQLQVPESPHLRRCWRPRGQCTRDDTWICRNIHVRAATGANARGSDGSLRH